MTDKNTKKRVGILSFHRIWNAGAFFVVLSLYEKLKNEGFEPIVIDFHPKAIHDQLKFSFSTDIKETISSCKGVAYNYRMFNLYGKIQNDFVKSSRIRNPEDIKCLNLDCIIASADIWNYDSIWCKNENLFFGKCLGDIPTIGYGVSLGVTDFTKSPPNATMLKNLQNYNYIFPRDAQTRDFCELYLKKSGEIVLDAAFMLDTSHLSGERLFKKPYLAVYAKKETLTKNAIYEIKAYAKEKNLKIVAPAYKNKFADSSFPYINPYNWLNIISNADYIFTSTFHGTVFPLLLKKRFATLLHDGIFLKTITMLENFDLKDHMYTEQNLNSIYAQEQSPKNDLSKISNNQFIEVKKIINSL